MCILYLYKISQMNIIEVRRLKKYYRSTAIHYRYSVLNTVQ